MSASQLHHWDRQSPVVRQVNRVGEESVLGEMPLDALAGVSVRPEVHGHYVCVRTAEIERNAVLQ